MLLMIDNYDSFTFNLVQYLQVLGAEVKVVRNDELGVGQIEALAPDRIVISPGPCTPNEAGVSLAVIERLGARVPILGVCLGHQLLALAAGAETRRLPVGHHGGNHAVIETETGRVDIGAHNHEVAVVDGPALLSGGYTVGHRDLNDGTVEGLVHRSGRIASVQFHPEGAPGPIDAARVFDLALAGALR